MGAGSSQDALVEDRPAPATMLVPYIKENFSRSGGWVLMVSLCGPIVIWLGLWLGRGHAFRALLRIMEMFVVFVSLLVLFIVLFFSERIAYGGFLASFALAFYLFVLSSEYLCMLWRHTHRKRPGLTDEVSVEE